MPGESSLIVVFRIDSLTRKSMLVYLLQWVSDVYCKIDLCINLLK